MKKPVLFASLILFWWGTAEIAGATLTTIGTATYGGSDYNLIYEDDQLLVWLDLTKDEDTWENQLNWASELGGTDPFQHLYSKSYWSGTTYTTDIDLAWYFYFETGWQDFVDKKATWNAMAVHSGEVSFIPLPGAGWLLIWGLAGLWALKRRFR
jgi:hypothetical protein